MFGIQHHLTIAVCKDADDATEKGYTYQEGYKPLQIEKAVVVQQGTENGNPTVDLVMQDMQGNKYVVMLTGRLLKSIPCEPTA